MLTAKSANPRGFGRVLRDEAGQIVGIVEAAHATPEQLAIQELNVGAYIFEVVWLWANIPKLPLSPKGEYYLTDLIAMAVDQGVVINSAQVESGHEIIGINTRSHLAEAEAALRQQINQKWMLAGVTMLDPERTYIEPRVEIGQDTIILPNTHLLGDTSIGSECIIGPNSSLRDSRVGDKCRIEQSVVEEAVLEDQVDVGPFAHLRSGAHLERGVHMGNFGEVKNSRLGPGVKMGHFSYIGDAQIGPDVNIGAGTITCNYDGKQKHKTEIGAGAFIGSDTMLVAPLRIGENARTGAGAVVTKNVPDDSVAVGVPARVVRKLNDRD
jgi:bifunctional UDP-N-acetylglucosamine pyrophosphorylase/glucosamine-1-phosphate N-acetyltransferase